MDDDANSGAQARTGRPRAHASAIVPGPALVTKQSATAIHSSMLLTKPQTLTETPSCHVVDSSPVRATSFLPHTTTIWRLSPLLALPAASMSAPRRAPMACATVSMPPTPSPPPTTSTVGVSSSMPSSVRISARERASGRANPTRRGNPCWRTCASVSDLDSPDGFAFD